PASPGEPRAGESCGGIPGRPDLARIERDPPRGTGAPARQVPRPARAVLPRGPDPGPGRGATGPGQAEGPRPAGARPAALARPADPARPGARGRVARRHLPPRAGSAAAASG